MVILCVVYNILNTSVCNIQLNMLCIKYKHTLCNLELIFPFGFFFLFVGFETKSNRNTIDQS